MSFGTVEIADQFRRSPMEWCQVAGSSKQIAEHQRTDRMSVRAGPRDYFRWTNHLSALGKQLILAECRLAGNVPSVPARRQPV